MEYQEKNATLIKEGKWDEKSCVRRQGGYDLDKTGLPSDLKYLPKGAALAYIAATSSATAKVKLCKTAVVQDDAASAATTLKVEKGHFFKVGDSIAGKAISAISTSNDDYDSLTVAALAAALTKGTIVDDGNASKVIGLNYATVKIESYTHCTPTIQAYEIEEDSLPYPLTTAIKTALTSRHDFKK